MGVEMLLYSIVASTIFGLITPINGATVKLECSKGCKANSPGITGYLGASITLRYIVDDNLCILDIKYNHQVIVYTYEPQLCRLDIRPSTVSDSRLIFNSYLKRVKKTFVYEFTLSDLSEEDNGRVFEYHTDLKDDFGSNVTGSHVVTVLVPTPAPTTTSITTTTTAPPPAIPTTTTTTTAAPTTEKVAQTTTVPTTTQATTPAITTTEATTPVIAESVVQSTKLPTTEQPTTQSPTLDITTVPTSAKVLVRTTKIPIPTMRVSSTARTYKRTTTTRATSTAPFKRISWGPTSGAASTSLKILPVTTSGPLPVDVTTKKSTPKDEISTESLPYRSTTGRLETDVPTTKSDDVGDSETTSATATPDPIDIEGTEAVIELQQDDDDDSSGTITAVVIVLIGLIAIIVVILIVRRNKRERLRKYEYGGDVEQLQPIHEVKVDSSSDAVF